MDLDYLQALMGEAPAVETAANSGILVVAEREGSGFSRVTFEMIGRARELADSLGARVSAAVLGTGSAPDSADLISRGADVVYLLQNAALAIPLTSTYVQALAALVEAKRPEAVLFGATSVGRDVAPRLAARLGTGFVSEVMSLEVDDSERLILGTTLQLGGALLTTLACPVSKPQIFTVRPGALRLPTPDRYREGDTETFDAGIALDESRVEVRETAPTPVRGVAISKARVIVAGGRGLDGPEGVTELKRLADALGGQVAGSRGAVEAGWLDKDQWVGVLGHHVSPDLYIACGIRGALQHRLGMKSSRCVVVINSDPDAPFFKYADFGLVGDYRTLVPAIVAALG